MPSSLTKALASSALAMLLAITVPSTSVLALTTSPEEFFTAVKAKDLRKLDQIAQAGSSLDLRNEEGDTAIIIAARRGDLSVLEHLVKLGADINLQDANKRDVLNIAITTRNPDLARRALDLGIDPAMVTSVYEGSALIYGSHQGAVEIVSMLIDAGAPLDHVNNLGWTALLEATILGDGSEPYQAIVEKLVEAGANKTIADRNGSLPIDHARNKGHTEIVELLED
ncbi:ankyrin repeat domain-containing protein [Pseudovibrio brasiliensis]|uniref:Ankyrin repeat domain-containing protein n=1 Tax=Pseudovibrio brasiliensis TaxID=1898042 RepID=A0ABX8AP66_9HYPH|nr:ankyrin repeat domain-containing protein [Pseudovibrio brasiliensis]QUS56027.1 ankyrin repeat domain-containing protein [Pseudovibrio brasiliensis]